MTVTAMPERLPDGFRIRIDEATHVADRGRVLVGGAPLTAMRIGARWAADISTRTLTVTDEPTAHLVDRLIDTNLASPVLGDLPAAPVADLTVVIPVRDRAPQLARALASLQPLHVVVVDDGSHDPDAVASVAAAHGARLVALTVNVGPAAARNAGLEQVRTRYVALVDSDVTATPERLLELTRHFADPRVALVGPRISGSTRTSRPRWFVRYEQHHSSLALGHRPAVVRPGAAVGWLPGACLVGRTDVLRGRFDHRLRVGEDVDLVWCLVEEGHRVRYEPAVEVSHDSRSSVLAWLLRKAVYGSSAATLSRRHGDAVAPAVLTPSLALAAASLLVRTRWSPAVATAAVALTAQRTERALPASPERPALASGLAVRALGWAVRQESSLLLRHWWPASLLAIRSRRVRRALATALIVDTAVALTDEQHHPERMPSWLLVCCRRLDDFAYGAGLWYGAARSAAPRALLPRRPRHR